MITAIAVFVLVISFLLGGVAGLRWLERHDRELDRVAGELERLEADRNRIGLELARLGRELERLGLPRVPQRGRSS